MNMQKTGEVVPVALPFPVSNGRQSASQKPNP